MKAAFALGAIALAVAAAASAQSPLVDQARAQGVAGERFDGYMGLAAPGPAALRSAIGAVNITRRSLYSDLAARKGASPQEVGLTAGCQLLARVQVGQAAPHGGNELRLYVVGVIKPRRAHCDRGSLPIPRAASPVGGNWACKARPTCSARVLAAALSDWTSAA